MHAIYVISIILISIGITLFLLSFIFEYTRKQNLKKRTIDEYAIIIPARSESKVIKNLVERVRHNQPAYEIKILMKNIKVFSNCRFKANSPQETFKKYIKEALSGHGCNTQTIEDYIDLVLAIQEIYYKNPENIRCDEEGIIIIDKAGIKIERKPYILTVSKI